MRERAYKVEPRGRAACDARQQEKEVQYARERVERARRESASRERKALVEPERASVARGMQQ